MKEGLHPEYKPSRIVCACGNVVETRSTKGDFHVEICAACHPFFTGKQKLMDTAGRIEKFKTRYGATPAEPAKKKVEARPEAAPAKKGEKKVETRAQRRARENAQKPKAEHKPPDRVGQPKPEEPAAEAAEASEPAKA